VDREIKYWADYSEEIHLKLKDVPLKWKPSIHMPKAAARIWLMITDVRVERLQDISEADALNEGMIKQETCRTNEVTGDKIFIYGASHKCLSGSWSGLNFSAIQGFRHLWSEINGYESWNANPWVWVIEYKRIEPCQ